MTKQRSKFRTLLVVGVMYIAPVLLVTTSIRSVSATQQLQYTGYENHVITLSQAAKCIQNFASNPTISGIKGAYFGRNIFDKILSQPGCVGLRYYYAKKDDGTATIVLVGVDGTGNDLVQGILGEETYPCPPFCPAPSVLYR
jgi:hypothetical protein